MTERHTDQAPKIIPASVASPEATGGIGTSYEQASIAAYLAALLTSSHAPACPGIVTAVAVQQQSHGRPLDDLVIDWQDDAGRCGTLDLQLKRTISLSSDAEKGFAKVVTAAWATMELQEFVDSRDLAGGLAEQISLDNLTACEKLSDYARVAGDADTFADAVQGPIGRTSVRAHKTVAEILAHHLGTAPTREQLHFFWRNFVLERLEGTSDRSRDRLRAIDQLRLVALPDAANATQLFAILEALAKQLNVRAAKVDSSQTRALLRDRFGTALASPPGGEDALALGRSAAEIELRRFCEQQAPFLVAPQFKVREASNRKAPDRRADLHDVETELRAARSLVLVGEPGAGKSSALRQIAATLLARPDIVPIVRELPHLAQHGEPIASQLIGKASLAAITDAHFADLANAARLVLLLDGWNELNAGQRQWAWGELNALQRSYPSILLIVATRAGTATPFADETALEVLPFDRERQFETARLIAGEAGHDLALRARAVPALRQLMRTPILLAAILRLGADGTMPNDRETVIAGLVTQAGGTLAQREQLRVTLGGQHIAYLREIAWQLMESGTISCPEDDLLPTIAGVTCALIERHMLDAALSPQTILDLLVNHHLLVATGQPGERLVSLQHHLIQEWFASFRISEMIEVETGGPVNPPLCRLLDAPFWSEAVMLAIERLSRARTTLPQLRALILTALGIEPFLAAEMFRHARPVLGQTLDAEIMTFVENWRIEDPDRAAAFMLATDLDQFGPCLWSTLETSRELTYTFHRSEQGFPITALLPLWSKCFPALQEETRRALLIDIIEQGTIEGLDLVVRAAAPDPSADVVASVVDYLDIYEEHTHLEQLLGRISRATWSALSRRRLARNLSETHRARWLRLRRKRVARAEGVEWIQLALEFDCAAPAAILDAVLNLKADNHWNTHALMEELFDRFPDAVRTALVARLLAGQTLPYSAKSYLEGYEPDDQDRLLIIARSGEMDYYRRQTAAQLLGRQSIAELVGFMVERARSPKDLRDEETRNARDALREVRIEPLLAVILECGPFDAAKTAALASILAFWRGDDDEQKLPLPPGKCDALIGQVRTWLGLFAEGGNDLSRSALADLAVLIGRIGSETLLPALIRLWESDKSRYAAERAAIAANPHDPRARMAFMCFDNQYRGAMLEIGGNAVIDAMSSKLDDPVFEHDAAVVLGQLLEIDPVQHGPMGPKMEDLAVRRARLTARSQSPPHPVAAKIIRKIETLMAAEDAEALTRAFNLAVPLTLMNYGDRGGVLRELIEAGKTSGACRDFCKAFAERGEAIPVHIIRDGIAFEAAVLAAKTWIHESELWRFEHWLRLIPYADDARAALPDFGELPAQLRRRYRVRDLVEALGRSISPTAVDALVHMLYDDPALFAQGFPRSLARIGTTQAANALLDALVALSEDRAAWCDTYHLREALTVLLARSAEARRRAERLLEGLDDSRKRGVIAYAFAETMNESEAIFLLELADAPSGAVIARVLIGQLEHAAVSRRPIEGMPNTFELEAAPLARLRHAAFRHLLSRPDAKPIRACLQAIDHLRDRYGKPVTEPNHPDFDSGKAWPTAAEPLWRLLADSPRRDVG